MNVSKHITYAEATKSTTAIRLGISNAPTTETIENMKRLATRIFEPVRREVAGEMPLSVNSFYRSSDVNAAVGGSLTSQHAKGEAIDIDADTYGNGTNRAVFDHVRQNLEFDQLIWEYGDRANPDWVHVSLRANENRHEVLRAIRKNGRTVYEKM